MPNYRTSSEAHLVQNVKTTTGMKTKTATKGKKNKPKNQIKRKQPTYQKKKTISY